MNDVSTVSVGLAGGRSYSIRVGADLFSKPEASWFPYGRMVAFVDSRVLAANPLWLERVVAAMRVGGGRVDILPVAVAESRKNLRSVVGLLDRLYALDAIDRRTVLVAIGGGVLGDMVGFAASIWLRGLRFIQVPTTVLAMVDSSVGGKTGVDFEAGKNLVGAFHQPESVWVDTDVLASLPISQWRSGLAEVVKYGIIRSPRLLEALAGLSVPRLRRNPSDAIPLIVESCSIKASVVSADEREESGLRAILNYGHTIGHALEGATNYRRYRHGEAISIGMVSAACLGIRVGHGDVSLLDGLLDLLDKLGLPRWLPADIANTTLISLATKDKKADAGILRFVLARSIGDVELRSVSSADVDVALDHHRLLAPGVGG